nr:ribonuclease H-like domain-containing protein [Tanacetum cinerariifolium]
DKRVIDSGCSRHMIGNRSYLTDYKEIDGGFVAFGGNSKGGKITEKDHLDKFDGMADEGFFVGYSTNSKAFRVFNSRTRIVEENLLVKFSKNTPNIVGSETNWLFDIDAPTESMNYKPVVVGNQSKRSLKDSHGAGYKPSGEEEKKDAEDLGNKDNEIPSIEEPRLIQENDSVISTNRVNAVCSTVNAASITTIVTAKAVKLASNEKAEEGSFKRAAGELEQEDAKRHRIKEENKSTELKRCLEIIPDDDDDVTIEATPLSSKSPTIVDYKIYKERRKNFFKILF